MKRKLFLAIACLAFFVRTIYAQDIIVMRQTGDNVKSKISEVGAEYVKYRKFENLTGPDYTVNASEVFMIKYESGSKDVFDINPATGKVQIRHIAAENGNPEQNTTVHDTSSNNNRTPTPVQTPAPQPPQSATAGKSGEQDSWWESVKDKLPVPSEGETLYEGRAVFANIDVKDFRVFFLLSADYSTIYDWRVIYYGFKYKGASITATNQEGGETKQRYSVGKDTTHLSLGATQIKGLTFVKDGAVAKVHHTYNDYNANSFYASTVDFGTADIVFKILKGKGPKVSATPKQTGANRISPDAYPQNNTDEIVDLLENNIIEAEITGSDITNVNLRIRRLVPKAVNVKIPAGSFFVSENPAAQNMVATAEKKTRLTTDGWVNVSIPAACANRPKDIPDSNDKFSVQRAPNQEELAQLMSVLGKSGAITAVKQAAVWIVTDNANFADLGTLTTSPGNTRAIWYETTTRAMKICAEAGIDITKKRIWNDRETIVSKLSAGELKNWLQNFVNAATPTTQSQPAPTQSQQLTQETASAEVDLKPYKNPVNNKWGYKDKNDSIVIPCKYSKAENFETVGLAMVGLDGKIGFINSKGQEIIPCKYGTMKMTFRAGDLIKVAGFYDGVATLMLDDKWGFIDSSGTNITPFKYEDAANFSEGMAAIKSNGKWGYIDKTGNMSIPCIYDTAESFTDGVAKVKFNGKEIMHVRS
jgi:hypothetical protein